MLWHYGRSNNVILSGISDAVADDILEESVISVLADIWNIRGTLDIEVCHRFGKADRKNQKRQFARLVNRKNCKKVLFNKRKAW